MEDWRIKDNKIICYNLLHKLRPFKVGEGEVERAVKKIQEENKCSEFEATDIYKKQLKQKVAEYERNTRTNK